MTGTGGQSQHSGATSTQEQAFPCALASCLGTCGVPIFPLGFIGRGMLPARDGNIRTGGLLVSEAQ